MIEPIEFEILGLPKMTNANTGHWRRRHREATKWKMLVMNECARLRITNLGLTSAVLSMTRHSSHEPDFDGLVSGFKHVIDGLVVCGVIVSDQVSVLGQPKYMWQYAKPGQGKIKVRIEPREESSRSKSEMRRTRAQREVQRK